MLSQFVLGIVLGSLLQLLRATALLHSYLTRLGWLG